MREFEYISVSIACMINTEAVRGCKANCSISRIVSDDHNNLGLLNDSWLLPELIRENPMRIYAIFNRGFLVR